MSVGPTLARIELEVLRREADRELRAAVRAGAPADRLTALARLAEQADVALDAARDDDQARLERRQAVAIRRALTANGSAPPGNARGSRPQRQVRGRPPRVARSARA